MKAKLLRMKKAPDLVIVDYLGLMQSAKKTENRVQEMTEKNALGAYEGCPLHFIGHLQKNKVKQVVGIASLTHSVDSLELIEAIDRKAESLGIVQDILKGARIIPVDTLENPKDGAVAGEFAPYAMHAFRITDGRKVAFAAPTDDGFAYTGLITAPRATHGEADGHIYLIWGACTDADFDHYELERAEGDSNDFRFVANVRNEVHDGVAYRCARYEDLGLKNHTRYAYRIRRVFRDGRKGEWSETVRCLTRQPGADAACDAKMLEFR